MDHGPRRSCEDDEYEREQRDEGDYDLDSPSRWDDEEAADDDPWWGCDPESGVL